ncbi:MAG: CoA transferase [Chloroflexi bacterium]|nr:CoA transferase [Chloroflexota bacterium]
MSGVLDGVKVVSMEIWWAGPFTAAYLADWGADVIKVEPVTGEYSRGTTRQGGARTETTVGGVPVNPGFQLRNRNKKSLAVDLKKEAGRDILYQLVRKADVFMSNYQLSAIKKLQLEYDTLSRLNPRLIYAVLSGYGSKGPDRDEAALDAVVNWARSGIQYLVSQPGSPPPQGPIGFGDNNASPHMLAGILGALLHREKTGEGQEVELSLLHCAVWGMSGHIQEALCGASLRESGGQPRNKSVNPIHINYRTKDDRWVQLAMTQSDMYWPDFCRAIERPEMENDPRFNSMEMRTQNCEELVRILDEVFASKDAKEWDKLCRNRHLIYSVVKAPEEVVNDPQALANDFFVDLHHPAGAMKVIASPVKFRQNPASVRAPAPELGQHTEEILLDLGYGWEDIARLKEQKVIF